MERRNAPREQTRRNDGRPQGGVPYHQLAENIAPQLAGLQVPDVDNNRNIEDGQIENETESLPGPLEQPQGDNERQGTVPYQQLAEDMAQPLAELHVPAADNERGDDVHIENETENCQGPHEPSQGSDKRQKRNPYNQLAADMAQPLADLQVAGVSNETSIVGDGPTDENESLLGPHELSEEHNEGQRRTQDVADLQVPGVNNEDKTSRDDQTKGESKTPRNVASVDRPDATTRRRGRNHYLDLAADIAGPLAEVRAPAISDERDSRRTQTRRQAVESIPHQESPSEYNPDATCGSSYESHGQRSLQQETSSEREAQASQGEGALSIAQQESLSEYNENASCGLGFFRHESDISDYSSVHTIEFESFGTDGFRSKSPSEIDTSQEACYSQVDGEPFSKRAKTDTEVSEALSLPVAGKSSMETKTVGDVDAEFSPRQDSIPDVCSMESKQNDSLPVQYEEINAQNRVNLSRPRNVVSPFERHLSSDFEHLDLAERNSVETGANFESSGDRSSPVSQSHQETSTKKVEDYSLVEKSTDSSVEGIDAPSYSTNSSTISQGARPKTSANITRGKKHKTPKQNTKNSYTELAKHVSGDLSAMNRQFDTLQTSTRRAAEEPKNVRTQALFDGSNENTVTSDAPSQHAPPLAATLGGGQGDTPQQPSLIPDEEHRGRDVRDKRERSRRETADSRASSRQTLGVDARAEHRAQVEEQQRLVDNMAPELQAMVIEMVRRQEEEQGGHVLMQWEPPVSARVVSQGKNANQGACAEGASKQSGGQKSRKGQKKKGHYFELAGVIAPQLAAVNAAMVNGHANGPAGTTDHRRDENHTGFVHSGAMGESFDQEHEIARTRDHHLSNQGAGVSSRDRSHAHMSLPHSATSRRETTDGRGAYSLGESARTSSQRRGGENRNHGKR